MPHIVAPTVLTDAAANVVFVVAAIALAVVVAAVSVIAIIAEIYRFFVSQYVKKFYAFSLFFSLSLSILRLCFVLVFGRRLTSSYCTPCPI